MAHALATVRAMAMTGMVRGRGAGRRETRAEARSEVWER